MSHVEQVASGDLPPAGDFLLSAGFAGVAAIVAALIVLGAVLYAVRRAGKQFLTVREDSERRHDEAQRAQAVARCWDRWWQVQQTAALEPSASEGATVGLGPEVALVLVRGLLRDAEQLGDDTLTKAIAVYQEQLLLVLAQQSGPLAKLASPPAARNGSSTKTTTAGKHESATPSVAAGGSSPEPRVRPKSGPATGASAEPTAETASAASEEAGRRRR